MKRKLPVYKIEFATSAAKEFRSLELQIKRRIAVAIEALQGIRVQEELLNYMGKSIYIAYRLAHIAWFMKSLTKRS